MTYKKDQYKFHFGESEMNKDSMLRYIPDPRSKRRKKIRVPWKVVKYMLELKRIDFDCYYTNNEDDPYGKEIKLHYYAALYYDSGANPLVLDCMYREAHWNFFFPLRFSSYGRALYFFLIFTGRLTVRYEWLNSLRNTIKMLRKNIGKGFLLDLKEDFDDVQRGLKNIRKHIPKVDNYPTGTLIFNQWEYDYCYEKHLEIYNRVRTRQPYILDMDSKVTVINRVIVEVTDDTDTEKQEVKSK